jgi:DNA-directed RNA polymerase specialized sigma24 family protein
MDSECLLAELTRFLGSKQACRLCNRYRVAPNDTLGALYLRLVERAQQNNIDDPMAWVNANGYRALQTHLRDEYGSSGKFNKFAKPGAREELAARAKVRETVELDNEVAERLDRQDELRWLNEALDKLSQQERDALFAHVHADGQSCRSVAVRSGVCTQTVCNRAVKAKAKLLEILNAQEERS